MKLYKLPNNIVTQIKYHLEKLFNLLNNLFNIDFLRTRLPHQNGFLPFQNDAEVGPKEDELSKSEQLQMLTENKELIERYAHNDTELDRIESNLAEIQRLQNTFTEKVHYNH